MPDATRQRLKARLSGGDEIDLAEALRPRGVVLEVGDGVAEVAGLQGAGSEELVLFDSGAYGFVYNLAADHTGVVLLSGADRVEAGQGAQPTGELPTIAAGRQLLGRMVDPLGRPIDGRPLAGGSGAPLFRPAPELLERQSVREPLHTGIMAIDGAIPLGRGQRQLIVGDRNTGKTALAADIIAAQRPGDVVCVYAAIGQPLSRVLATRDALAEQGALGNTVIVSAEAADSPGLQHLAPYAAMAVAEWFCLQGEDALIIFDDLTKHADAYRELALLMGRPPGREAFPGDIFYIHAELLERSCVYAEGSSAGSVTALPLIETTDNDIAAYIPTNLVSITDGQVYLDSGRFERNQRPAIDIGRSVSRIGGAAQSELMRLTAHNLRIDMARFESLESLTRVGLDVDPQTKADIHRGRVIRELLKQGRFEARSAAEVILALTAVDQSWMADLTPERARRHIWASVDKLRSESPELVTALDEGAMPEGNWVEMAAPAFRLARPESEAT